MGGGFVGAPLSAPPAPAEDGADTLLPELGPPAAPPRPVRARLLLCLGSPCPPPFCLPRAAPATSANGGATTPTTPTIPCEGCGKPTVPGKGGATTGKGGATLPELCPPAAPPSSSPLEQSVTAGEGFWRRAARRASSEANSLSSRAPVCAASCSCHLHWGLSGPRPPAAREMSDSGIKSWQCAQSSGHRANWPKSSLSSNRMGPLCSRPQQGQTTHSSSSRQASHLTVLHLPWQVAHTHLPSSLFKQVSGVQKWHPCKHSTAFQCPWSI
jgi:hypothetical protein